MPKRLTIADYKSANEKLVEERNTFKKERDDALRLSDSTEKDMNDLKVELLELLGGYPQHDGFGIGSRRKATKVQIARRAGELVAAERLAERLGRIVFDDHVEISGVPVDLKGVDFGHPHGDRTVKHVHTMDCLPPEMREGAKNLVDTIAADLTKHLKARARRRRFWSLVLKLVIVVPISLAIGYFVAAALF